MAQCCTQYLPKALDEYEHWRVHEAGFSLKTWGGEKPGLLAFVDFMASVGIHYVKDVGDFHVSAWWSDLGVAASTRSTRLHQLRSFLEYCIHRGWLEKDPTLLLRAPRPAARIRERLDAGELLNLIELARTPQNRIILALAANLGLRASEIRDLRLKDVHLANAELHVRPEKTRTAEDAMPISTELDMELRRWLDHYLEVCNPTRLSYLVPSVYVDNQGDRTLYRHIRPIGQHYAAEVVKDALTRLGWENTLGEGVHTIRRSVGRLFFDVKEQQESFDSALLATMELLHHTRSDTTLTYIGKSRGQATRDSVLKGKPFLSTLAPNARNLRAV